MSEPIQIVQRSLFPKCPYCQDLIKPNEAVVVCSEEHAYLHLDCREIDPSCPILGCDRELQYFGVKRPNVIPHERPEAVPEARDMTIYYSLLFATVALFALSVFCINVLRDEKGQLEVRIHHMARSRIRGDVAQESRKRSHKKRLIEEDAEKAALRQHNKDLTAKLLRQEAKSQALLRTQRRLQAALMPSQNCIVTGKRP
ncbi:MAG: hypothetical protein P1V97_37475 [Planctomycetota bacterium]|nr:hypothetical protein [Planctomycetota bacterium]